jgi:hypothetical protein
MEANKTDSGKTKGIILGIENNKNLTIIMKSKSLPANSPMKSQIDWRIKMKKRITKTVVNVIRKDFNKYLSSIFTYV